MLDIATSKDLRRPVPYKVAIVQGENFRCVAAKSDSNPWVHALNGRPLFGVLEEVKILCSCERHSHARCPCPNRQTVLAKCPPPTIVVAMESKDQQELNRVRSKLKESGKHLHSIEQKVEDLQAAIERSQVHESGRRHQDAGETENRRRP